MGTLTAKGTMLVWVWKLGVVPRSQSPISRSLSHLGEVADAAVDDRADAAAPHEEGEHHLAEDSAVQVATGIYDDDVTGLGVVEGVAVELFFRVGVFIDRILVFALGHKLQGQGWADDVLARGAGDRALDVGVADAQAGEFASGRGAANAGRAGRRGL